MAGEKDANFGPSSSEVSRKHCAILVEEGAAAIEDCGSTNGTFLNDQRISGRQELKDGDRIRVGMLGLEVRLSVGIGSEKKPKVHSVQEAAARTVASVPVGGDDLDISGWLGDESTLDLAPTRKQPATAGDTIAGKSGDTITGKSLTTRGPCLRRTWKRRRQKRRRTPAKGAGKHPSSPRQAARRRQRRGRRRRAAAVFPSKAAIRASPHSHVPRKGIPAW